MSSCVNIVHTRYTGRVFGTDLGFGDGVAGCETRGARGRLARVDGTGSGASDSPSESLESVGSASASKLVSASPLVPSSSPLSASIDSVSRLTSAPSSDSLSAL